MRYPRLFLIFAVPILLSAIVSKPVLADSDPWKPMDVPATATPREVQLGDEAAKELEGSPKIKIWKPDTPEHKATIDKLNAMVQELGKVSARPGIAYQVKVIDDPAINSFTLPNGKIYVYTGLLNALGSDDEIAAVLGHEIGHNARMHALRGLAKSRKLSLASLLGLLAMVAGGTNGANVGQFSQYLLVSIMNGYSIEYEKEADVCALQELSKTHYNPSAMVTVMQRFESQEALSPDVQLGIYQDHPSSPERVQSALAGLKRLGVAYTPRDVHGSTQVEATMIKDRAQVKIGKLLLMEFAAANANDADAKTRSETAAAHLNDLLRTNLRLPELTSLNDGNGTLLVARGQIIARCTPRDAALQGLTPQATVQKWLTAFQSMFWQEQWTGKMG